MINLLFIKAQLFSLKLIMATNNLYPHQVTGLIELNYFIIECEMFRDF